MILLYMQLMFLKNNDLHLYMVPKEAGIYALILQLEKSKTIKVGKPGFIEFKNGFYIYIGSAMGGLRKRIKSHINKNKKPHWHIDYLMQEAKLMKIAYLITDARMEDNTACFFENHFDSIKGFGASDSKICSSHLFFSESIKSILLLFKKLNTGTAQSDDLNIKQWIVL